MGYGDNTKLIDPEEDDRTETEQYFDYFRSEGETKKAGKQKGPRYNED